MSHPYLDTRDTWIRQCTINIFLPRNDGKQISSFGRYFPKAKDESFKELCRSFKLFELYLNDTGIVMPSLIDDIIPLN